MKKIYQVLLFLCLLSATSFAQSTGRVVDVLVLYTSSVKTHHGTADGVQAHVQALISSTNTAYQDSGIDGSIHLAGIEEIAYTESSLSLENDLSAMRNLNDGVLDQIPALRASAHADIVIMLRKNPAANMAGVAYQLVDSAGRSDLAFAVVVTEYATGPQYAFAHEIGHLLGCSHARGDAGNPGTPLYPYSYGYRFNGNSGTQYHTIMAYNPGTAIPRFSNPNLTYDGVATGIPASQANSADAATTINQTFPLVAAYDAVLPPVISSHPSNQSVTEPDTATFHITAEGSALSYQWQKRQAGFSAWSDIADATNSTYTTPATTFTESGQEYRCIVSQGSLNAISQSATLTVQAAEGSIATLNRNYPVTGIHAASDVEKHYRIYLPAAATQLTIQTYGGSGDVYLFAKHAEPATFLNADEFSFEDGNSETITINDPEPGYYYIMIIGFNPFSDLTLVANYTAPQNFATWIDRPDIPSSRRGMLDTPADDGVSNLVKYFHGVSPLHFSSEIGIRELRRHSLHALRFRYRKNLNVESTISHAIQWSTQLSNWQNSGDTVAGITLNLSTISVEPDSSDPQTVWVEAEATSSSPLPPQVFLRLEITASTP